MISDTRIIGGMIAAIIILSLWTGCIKLFAGMKPKLKELWQRRKDTGFFVGLIAASFFLFVDIEAGATKPVRDGGTNEMQVMSAPLSRRSPMRTMSQIPDVTDAEIARGYRLKYTTNDLEYSYIMPESASTFFNWHLRGTFCEWQRLDLDDFSFPLGSNNDTYASFSVFSDGKIRPVPRDSEHEICAVGIPMLAMQGASRFWVGDGDEGGKLLTWENFFLDGDTNAPVNAQIALKTNGDFTTRSNEFVSVYSRINPDDWDGDGLANPIDPSPYISDGDCYGTGEGWLAANPAVSAATNANSAAYYALSFCPTADKTKIEIVCDGPSNLGNMTVIANAGDDCEVPLLIGAGYFILASSPLDGIAVSDSNAEISYFDNLPASQSYMRLLASSVNGGSRLSANFAVAYPLNFECSPSGNGGWTLSVLPKNPGVEISSISGGCCVVEATSSGFSWVCSPNCTCAGDTRWFDATALWEGYSQPFSFYAECGCGNDDETPSPGPQSGPYSASVGVSFSKNAIIFEDAYENTPGEWVERHSTSATLTITAHGGPNGGVLTATAQNLEKLQKNSGPAFPTGAVNVPAGQSVTYEMNYVGLYASSNVNDIVVTASFEENGGTNINSNAHLTSICVSLEVDKIAPNNPSVNRHVYGVCEKVRLSNIPIGVEIDWNSVGATNVRFWDDWTTFYCHYQAENSIISATYGTVELMIPFVVISPRVICSRAVWDGQSGSEGISGNVAMLLSLYVEPRIVSFEGLLLQEVIDDSQGGGHSGYFDDQAKGGSWSHDYASGAGDWHIVSTNGYWFTDVPRIVEYSQPWSDGWKEWEIPVGWCRPWLRTPEAIISPNPTTQRFEISANGTVRIQKYGHEIKRATDNKVWLDGERVDMIR